MDGADVRKLGPELHERLAARQPGVVSRDERWWQVNTGQAQLPGQPWTEPFYAVYRSAAGEVEGLVAYEADDKWGDAKQPLNTATVRDLIAADPGGGARAVALPLLDRLDHHGQVGLAGPGRPAPAASSRTRARRRILTQADLLWVRILDVVRALEARTYADRRRRWSWTSRTRAGLAGGRFRLDASPDGATCVPTSESPI